MRIFSHRCFYINGYESSMDGSGAEFSGSIYEKIRVTIDTNKGHSFFSALIYTILYFEAFLTKDSAKWGFDG